jgi:hypothetical protein
MARARISKIIRKIPPIKPPRQGKKSRISENFRDRMHLVEAALSRYIASILLKNRSKEHFEPVLHKLDRVLFVTPKLEGEKVSRFTGSGAAVEEFDKFSENLRSNSVEMSEVPAKSDQFLKAMKREFGINK